MAGKKPKKPARVADVGSALAQREKKVGKTVRLRAIRRGYYGVAGVAADIREPGDVFEFAIKDLEPFKGGEYHDGTARRSITVNGAEYALPSWCVDPSAPAEDDEEEEDDETDGGEGEATAGQSNQDVI